MWGILTGILGKVFGVGASITSAVTGSLGTAVEKVGDMAGAAFKDPGDLQSARQFAAPQAGGGWFRSVVDAINCAIRPAIVIYLGGLIAGWWAAPDLGHVNPVYLQWFENVMTFYFGQRAVVYDMPRLIAGLRAAFRA